MFCYEVNPLHFPLFAISGSVVLDEFVLTRTTAEGVVISCEGCLAFADSKMIADSEQTDFHGCCVHSLTLPLLLSVFPDEHQDNHNFENNQSVLQEYLRSELESAISTILVKKWGHYTRYLVSIPHTTSVEESVPRFSTCTVLVTGRSHSLHCDSVKCKRGKNKKIPQITDDSDICCHLKELMTVLREDAQMPDSFACGNDDPMYDNSGNCSCLCKLLKI
jgi:hypothetical protein